MITSNGAVTTRRRVIDLLLLHGELSRAELARVMRLSKPAVSATVADLIAEGVIQETGFGLSTNGRKPILLRLSGSGHLAVGVEIDAGSCRLLLVTLDGEQVTSHEFPADTSHVNIFLDALANEIDVLFLGRVRDALIGCGVAVPGLIDLQHDTVDCAARLGWHDVPLRALVAARLGVPVFVTDRGKAAGLGERWFLGREHREDLLYLYLGQGVAGAIVFGNTLHLGPTHTAGEIGHMVVDPGGPRCTCGQAGCLEAFISITALRARLRNALVAGHRSLLTERDATAEDAAMIAAIGGAAMAGDAYAHELVAQVAHWLGLAITSLVHILNPAVVVLGGPLAMWGDLLTVPITRHLDDQALPVPRGAVRVVISEAGALAPSLGAAALVLGRAGELLARRHTAALVVAS